MIGLTLPSYTPSSIARITSGAILHRQNDTMGGVHVRVCVGRVRKGGEGAHQKGVPTKEFAGALEDAEPKSAGGRERAIKIGTQKKFFSNTKNSLLCNVQLITGASS